MSDLQADPATGESTEGLATQPTIESLTAQLEQKENDIQTLKGQWGSKNADQQKVQRELETKLANLDGRVNEQTSFLNSQRTPEVDPYLLTDEQKESFNNDPASMVEHFRKVSDAKTSDAIEEAMGKVFATLKARDEYVDTSLSNARSLAEEVKAENDPELAPYRTAIAELRKNETFATLDDKMLMEIAKSQGTEPAMEWRGDAGGQRQREVQKTAVEFDPTSAQGRMVLQMENGNTANAEALWNRMEARRIQ
jgi:hypothetical protein